MYERDLTGFVFKVGAVPRKNDEHMSPVFCCGELTHGGRDKIASFLQTTFLKCFFFNVRISIKTPLKFVPKGSIDNIAALV